MIMNKPEMDLRALRKRKGWSQLETAERLGFCRTYITDVENKRQGISKAMMRSIIQVFGVKYEDFYTDDTERKDQRL